MTLVLLLMNGVFCRLGRCFRFYSGRSSSGSPSNRPGYLMFDSIDEITSSRSIDHLPFSTHVSRHPHERIDLAHVSQFEDLGAALCQHENQEVPRFKNIINNMTELSFRTNSGLLLLSKTIQNLEETISKFEDSGENISEAINDHINCSNVLKKRRKKMRRHKHKKRLKKNRYKTKI